MAVNATDREDNSMAAASDAPSCAEGMPSFEPVMDSQESSKSPTGCPDGGQSMANVRDRHQQCLRLLHTHRQLDEERGRSQHMKYQADLEQIKLRFELEGHAVKETCARERLELTQEVELYRAQTSECHEAMARMQLERQVLSDELKDATQQAFRWCREAEELSEASGAQLAQQDALHAELERKEKLLVELQAQVSASVASNAELRSEYMHEKEAAVEAVALKQQAQEKAEAWHAEQVRHAELLHRLWLQHLDVQEEKARSESKLRHYQESSAGSDRCKEDVGRQTYHNAQAGKNSARSSRHSLSSALDFASPRTSRPGGLRN